MELIAFTHAAAAYEDPTPPPQLRSLDAIHLDIPSSSWMSLLSAAVFVSSVNSVAQPAQALTYYGYGDNGAGVEEIQSALADLEYYEGEISGEFDAATEAALTDFQDNQGLYVDGVAGEDTLTALGLDPLIDQSTATEVEDVTVNSTDGTLRLGDEGSLVEDLQIALSEEGYYSGDVDGVFGNDTLDAVRAFQDENGLEADGIVGASTWDALGLTDDNEVEESTDTGGDLGGSSLRYGDESTDVKTLQSVLADEGYYFGAIDGVFSDETLDAVLAFQKDNDLTVDGVAGGDTLEALGLSNLMNRSSTT
jgi:peptidoglycan hydrolase-like protein with peptidoglycan-binding domain